LELNQNYQKLHPSFFGFEGLPEINSIPMMKPEKMLEGKDLGPQNSTLADLNKVDC
jgi:hypothetical protein